ncbi:MAG: protein kinase, partial [Phycisphaeraceae bacterium]|nr:protein kinase [Phycisphaeraceae bacterium]
VHRDLKPGNILVIGEPASASEHALDPSGPEQLGQPKVLDFGVSRMLVDPAADVTRLTRTGLVVGTIAYMSPEQARGDPSVDTRSDVYSLGVIGYELLSGRLPHGSEETPLLSVLRRIQEGRAPRLGALGREFRGDISIIFGKALAAEREHRYGSAAALAEDIRRHLASQPIAARPPTITYQIARFVRRNK